MSKRKQCTVLICELCDFCKVCTAIKVIRVSVPFDQVKLEY